ERSRSVCRPRIASTTSSRSRSAPAPRRSRRRPSGTTTGSRSSRWTDALAAGTPRPLPCRRSRPLLAGARAPATPDVSDRPDGGRRGPPARRLHPRDGPRADPRRRGSARRQGDPGGAALPRGAGARARPERSQRAKLARRADAGAERRHHGRRRAPLRTGAEARPRPDGRRRPTHPRAEDASPRRPHRRAAPDRHRARGDTDVDRPRALAVRPAPRLGRGARAGDATAIRGGTRTSPRTLAGRAAGTTRGRAAARPRAALPAAGRVGGVAAAERVVTRLGTLAAIILLVPAVGFAHGLDPASLALRETRAGVFEVRWRASALRLPGANVQP